MKKQYTFQIATIGALFFFFGFVTWTNSILVPYLKIACELSNFQSYLVTFAFYVAYFVMAIPSSIILRNTGYKNGIVLGLLVCATGTLLFIPAAMNRNYMMFLSALYILGTGLAILQTAANPYITLLGTPEGASSRINIMGTCASIAGMAAPIIFGSIILKDSDNLQKQVVELSGSLKVALLNSLSERVIAPYAILTLILVLLSMMIWFSKLPDIEKEAETFANPTDRLWKYNHLVLGIVAIFSYVGVEVLAIDSIVNYGSFQGYPMEIAKKLPFICLFGMFIGRFIGIFLIGKKVTSQTALYFNSFVAVLLVIIALFTNGILSLICIILLSLCNSIMWASIFPLAIAELGSYTKRGSSFLIMAIVGGALIPPLYGKIADLLNNDLMLFRMFT